jgi:hypothetical protein
MQVVFCARRHVIMVVGEWTGSRGDLGENIRAALRRGRAWGRKCRYEGVLGSRSDSGSGPFLVRAMCGCGGS